MKIAFSLDCPMILANQARTIQFAIRFAADAGGNPRRKPAAFCGVVDRSGSMAGPPLAHAGEAAKVAVATFGDTVSASSFLTTRLEP